MIESKELQSAFPSEYIALRGSGQAVKLRKMLKWPVTVAKVLPFSWWRSRVWTAADTDPGPGLFECQSWCGQLLALYPQT